MGWLWMCLNGYTSPQRLRVNGGGRVSSDTEALRHHSLPAQIGFNTPRIEDFLQAPRRASAGRDAESPTLPMIGTSATFRSKEVDGRSRKNLQAHVEELSEELEALKQKFAEEAANAAKLREEVSYLRSCGVDDLVYRGKSLERETLIPDPGTVNGNWNPCWGCASEAMSRTDKGQGEDRQAVPSARKSFSELLMGTDSSDETFMVVKGPLALAATAVAAERAAKKPSGAKLLTSRNTISTIPVKALQSHQSGAASRVSNGKVSNTQGSGQKTAECRQSLVNILKQENEYISQQQQRILLEVSKPSSGRELWHSGVLSVKQGRSGAEERERPYVTMLRNDSNEALDLKWIDEADTSSSSTHFELAKDGDAGITRTPGILLKDTTDSASSARDLKKGGKRRLKGTGRREPNKKWARNPQSSHSTPLLAATSNSLLSEHNEDQVASAVAASKEGRLQLQLTERSMHQVEPRVSVSRSRISIGNLFRSGSRKRAVPFRSGAFGRPLSPVPESLSLDEGFWSRRSSTGDAKDPKLLPKNLRFSLTNGLERPDEDARNFTQRNASGEANSGLGNPSFSFKSTGMASSTPSIDNENQQHGQLAPLYYSNASYVAMPRSSRRKHSSALGRAPHGSSRWTFSDDTIDLHPSSKDSRWHAEKIGSSQTRKESDGPKAEPREANSESGSNEPFHDARTPDTEGSQAATELRCQSSSPGESETSWCSSSRSPAEDDSAGQRVGQVRDKEEQRCHSTPLTEPQQSFATTSPEQDGCQQRNDSEDRKSLRVSNQVQYWNSLQKAAAGKENATTCTLAQPDSSTLSGSSWVMNQVRMWNSLQMAASSKEKPTTTITLPRDCSFRSGTIDDEFDRSTDSCENGSSTASQSGEMADRDATTYSTLDEAPDATSSTSEGTNYSQEDDATSLSSGGMHSGRKIDSNPIPCQVSSDGAESQQSSQSVGDTAPLRTPQKHPQVAPDTYFSPNGTKREASSTRLLDMKPEERPIFGSVAGHWEAAWSTKRQTWDGKGIPNSTHKYKEHQKVKLACNTF